MEFQQARELVTSSDATAGDLYQIATDFPVLAPWIAANPACYDALLEWLKGSNDPGLQRVLKARSNGKTGADALREAEMPELVPAGIMTGSEDDAEEDVDTAGSDAGSEQDPNNESDEVTVDTTAVTGTDVTIPSLDSPDDDPTAEVVRNEIEQQPSNSGAAQPEQQPQSWELPEVAAVAGAATLPQAGTLETEQISPAPGQPPVRRSVKSMVTPTAEMGVASDTIASQPTATAAGSVTPAAWVPPVTGTAAAGAAASYGQYPGYAQMQQVMQEPEPPKQKSSALTIILSLLLLVAVVVLAVVLTIFFLGSKETNTEPSQSAVTGSAPQQEQGSSDSGTGSEPNSSSSSNAEGDTGQTLYPAPADAQPLTSFTSPTGNIYCRLANSSAYCNIGNNKIIDDSGTECGKRSLGVTLTSSDVTARCEGDPEPSDAQPLPYGQSATIGQVACSSREDGMVCWDTHTGQAFKVAVQGLDRGTEGPLP